MESWSCYKIEDLFEVKNGAAIQSKDFTLNKIDDSYMEVLKIGHIAIGGGLRKEPKKNYVHKTSKLDKFILQKGDIVMAMTDMKDNVTILGVSAMVEEDNKYILNQRVACLRKKTTIDFDDKFVYYQMRTRRFLLPLQKQANRGVQVNLTTDHIRNSIVFLPSLAEQKKISSLFTDIESKIDNNYKICKVLEAQAQALFKHWFVDFAPFKDGKFVESELGLIPEGWKISNIYEYIDVIYGAPYKSSLFNDKKNGLPLIRIRDLKTYSPQFYTPEILPTTEYIEAGNVVAGMDAEFIPYIWLGERGVLNQRCCKFKGKDNRISNYYILFLVKPELEYVQSYKTGTTVSHLGKSDIDRFRVVSPPLDVILSFSDIVDSMKEEIVTIAKESLRLATLRDALLPKLMSGQIKL